jgi:hypothetical protein
MTDTTNNYFTEVEDHFRALRGTPTFIFSSLDWALLETWKTAGIPLAAVLRGIDTAFDRWRKRPPRARTRSVNSLAYCTNAVAEEAQALANGTPLCSKDAAPPFSLGEMRRFVGEGIAKLRNRGFEDVVASLEALDLDDLYPKLEQLEERLSAIEEKMIAKLRESATKEALLEARRALDRDLKAYRGKMTADQLAMLERQFLDRRMLESARLPRLSLFYLV